MTQSHLENCPFCGGPVELIEKSDKLGVIRCADTSPCMGSGLGIFIQLDRKDEAILAWNTRSTEARAEGLVAALEKTQSLVAKCCPSGFKDEAAVRALYENNGAICDALTAYRSARP